MTRPRRSETELTAEHLRRVLIYDAHTGLWKWREQRKGSGPLRKAGWWPGGKTARGYCLAIRRKVYATHRLAFLYMTGAWPEHEIDHIDGDFLNNRWANLRPATPTENHRNVGLRSHNTSGFRGVTLHKGRWRARVTIDRKLVDLGYFPTPEEASQAYEMAAQQAFGDYYRRLQ